MHIHVKTRIKNYASFFLYFKKHTYINTVLQFRITRICLNWLYSNILIILNSNHLYCKCVENVEERTETNSFNGLF